MISKTAEQLWNEFMQKVKDLVDSKESKDKAKGKGRAA